MRDPEVKEIILLPTGEAVVASAFTLRVILDHLLTPGVRWLFSRLASRGVDKHDTPFSCKCRTSNGQNVTFLSMDWCTTPVMEPVEDKRSVLRYLEQTLLAGNENQVARPPRRH